MSRKLLRLCGRTQSSTAVKDDAAMFCSSLVEGIAKLDRSLREESITLGWCVDAMRLLKEMQENLLLLLKKPKLPVISDRSSGHENCWLEQYMQETATLLDFCNSLKCSVSRMNRYCMVIDFLIHRQSLVDALGDQEKQQPSDFNLVKQMLSLGGIKIGNGGGSDEKYMVVAILAAKATMIVVSLLLVSAMGSPISIDLRADVVDCRIPELKLCLESLVAIAKQFSQQVPTSEIDGCRLVVIEQVVVYRVLKEFKGLVLGGAVVGDHESFLKCLETLTESSTGLKKGVEMFEAAVDEVFGEAVRGRNELLEVFRDEAHISDC